MEGVFSVIPSLFRKPSLPSFTGFRSPAIIFEYISDMYSIRTPAKDESVEEMELGDAQMVPDGAKDVERISHL